MSETTTQKPRKPRTRVGWKRRFIENLRKTANVRMACIVSGVSRQAPYKVRARDAKFAALWDDAMEDACDLLEQEAWRRAYAGVTRKIFYKDKQIDTVKDYSDGLLSLLLKRHRPAQFRDHYSIVQVAKSPSEIEMERIEQLTPEERDRRIDELLARRARARAAKEAANGRASLVEKTGVDT